jgi:uncharacterized protein
MKVILRDNRRYILRFDREDEVISGLIKFAKTEHIAAGTFTALGACSQVILSYYDLQKKEYHDRTLFEDMEIVSVTGNIGRMNDKAIIHAHGVFSDKELQTMGGHIKSLTVSATCEVFLIKLEGEITRGFDEETGLNIMQ